MEYYSDKTLNLFHSVLENYTDIEISGQKVIGYGGSSAGQGPHIHLCLGIGNRVILETNFKTYGCPGCIACSKAICMLIEGKNLEQASKINVGDLKEIVGELPRAKRHCYNLALQALSDALQKTNSKGFD